MRNFLARPNSQCYHNGKTNDNGTHSFGANCFQTRVTAPATLTAMQWEQRRSLMHCAVRSIQPYCGNRALNQTATTEKVQLHMSAVQWKQR